MRSLKMLSGIIVFIPILSGLILGPVTEANPVLPQHSASPQGTVANADETIKHQAEAAYLAGTGAERERNHVKAETAYRTTLKLARENRLTQLEGASLHRLAVLKAKENQVAESEQFFREAKPFCENNVVFHCDYAKLHMDQKRFQFAETILKAGALLAPNDRRVLYNLGYAIAMQPDRQTEGLRYLKLALGEKKAYEELSKIYRSHGNEGQAEFAGQRAKQIDAGQPLPEISQDVQNRIRKELSWHEGKMMVSELNKVAAQKEEQEKQTQQQVSQTVKTLPGEKQADQNQTKSPKALPADETKTESEIVRQSIPIGPDPFLLAIQTTSKDQIVPQNKPFKSLPMNEQNPRNEQDSVRSLPEGQKPAFQQIAQNPNVPKTETKPVERTNSAPIITIAPTINLHADSKIRNENIRQNQENPKSNPVPTQGQPTFAVNRTEQIPMAKQDNVLRTNSGPTIPETPQLAFKPKNEPTTIIRPTEISTNQVPASTSMRFAKTGQDQQPKVNLIPPNAVNAEQTDALSHRLRSNAPQQQAPLVSNIHNQDNIVRNIESSRPIPNRPLYQEQFIPQHHVVTQQIENGQSTQFASKKLEFVSKPTDVQNAASENDSLPMLSFRPTETIQTEQPTFALKSGPSFEVRNPPAIIPSNEIKNGPAAPMPNLVSLPRPIEKQIQYPVRQELVVNVESKAESLVRPSEANNAISSRQELKPNVAQNPPRIPQQIIVQENVPMPIALPKEKPVHLVPVEQARTAQTPKPQPMQIPANEKEKPQQKPIEIAAKPVFTTPNERTVFPETPQPEENASKVHWVEPTIALTPTVVIPVEKKTAESNVVKTEVELPAKPVDKRPVEMAENPKLEIRQLQQAKSPVIEPPNKVEVTKQTVRPIPNVQSTSLPKINKIPYEYPVKTDIVQSESKKSALDRQPIEIAVKDDQLKQEIAKNQQAEIKEISRPIEIIRNEPQIRPEQKQQELSSEFAKNMTTDTVPTTPVRNNVLHQTVPQNQPEQQSIYQSKATAEFVAVEKKIPVERTNVQPKTEERLPEKPQQDSRQIVRVQKEIPKTSYENLPVFVPTTPQQQLQQIAMPQKNTVDLADKLEVLQQQQPVQIENQLNEMNIIAQKTTPQKTNLPNMFSEEKFEETLELLQQTDVGKPETVSTQNPYPAGFASTQHGIVSASEWEELRLQTYSMPIQTERQPASKTAQVIVRENIQPDVKPVQTEMTVKTSHQNAGFARSGQHIDSVQKQQPVEHQPIINWDRFKSLGEQKRRW